MKGTRSIGLSMGSITILRGPGAHSLQVQEQVQVAAQKLDAPKAHVASATCAVALSSSPGTVCASVPIAYKYR